MLEVDHLNIFLKPEKRERLLYDISFSLGEGEILAVIGESGSGKSILTRSLTNLFSHGSPIVPAGSVKFFDRELSSMRKTDLRELRKTSVRYVFQDPAQVLNPSLKIRSHLRLMSDGVSSGAKTNETLENEFVGYLTEFGVREPESVLRLYPHQLSVGMIQRMLVAMAMMGEPKLIIADEPTSAIDAILRRRLLDVLCGRCKSKKLSLIMTTHDLAVARAYADRILVLYAGRIVETAPADMFFREPYHPYSRLLLESQPGLAISMNIAPLESEPGIDQRLSSGCKFHPRCFLAREDCKIHEPILTGVDGERSVRCPYWK